MPTIDELAPATAAADNDELPVSQNSVTRKITRAQILSGVQPQIAIGQGTILGRSSSGTGAPETITVGRYLSLTSGTLCAAASPYSIALSPPGLVPSTGDSVPISQGGTNVAVSYSTFLQGLSGVTAIDGGQLLVTPTGNTVSLRLADLASSVVCQTGASMSGPLNLASDPVGSLQAATKHYADLKLNRNGDTLSGPLQLSADPVSALQAATKSYVDTNAGLIHVGLTMTGPIVLAGDPTAPLNPATKSYTDARLLRTGDTMLGPLGLTSAPTSSLQAATKGYVDSQVATSLPVSGGVLNGPLVLVADPTASLQAATKQYTDSKLSRAGDAMSGPLTLAGAPTNSFHATTKLYVDNQFSLALQRTGGTMSGPVLLSGDPTASSQAATKSYVDAGLVQMLPVTGGTVVGPVVLAMAPGLPGHATNKQYVDAQLSGVLALSGGSLTGPLALVSGPIIPLHAATKQYVDANPGADGVINVRLPPCNAALNGKTDDTSAFTTAYQMALPGGTIYVPNGTTVIQPTPSWGIQTSKRVKWIIDGTVLADGTALGDAISGGQLSGTVALPATVSGFGGSGTFISQGTSQSTDFAVARTSYIVNHSGGSAQTVISNSRNDTIISQSPLNHVWAGMDHLVWNGTQTPSAASPSRHISRYTQTIRQSVGTDGSGSPLPQPLMWAGYVEFRDTTGKPSSWTNGSTSLEVDWYGNGVDDANQRQIQSLVLGQDSPTGAPVEVATAVGISLATGSAGKVYRVFNISVPYAISILDTTNATQLSGAAAIRMAAGQAIAFEPNNTVNLSYASALGAIIAKYGASTCAIGRGISVSFGIVVNTTTSIPATSAGSIVFLVGSGPYTITLPAAGTVMAGTGFTFSVVGTGSASIVAAAGDSIDLAPIILHQYDRYHIVSDGSSLWRETFKTNSVSPRFAGPPVFPSYTVAGLPGSPPAGAKAFVTNGRKPNEGTGSGTGIEVFYDGAQWISVCSGLPVAA